MMCLVSIQNNRMLFELWKWFSFIRVKTCLLVKLAALIEHVADQ